MLINRSAIQIYKLNSNAFEFKEEGFFLSKMLINRSAIQIYILTFLKIIINQNLKKKNYGKEPF